MDQRRRLQRMSLRLVCQASGGQLAQLIVNQRQELSRRSPVAPLNVCEDSRDVAHGLDLPGRTHRRGSDPSSVYRGVKRVDSQGP